MTYGNILEFKNNVITGKVLTDQHCMRIQECKEFAVCKLWFLRKIKFFIGGITICVGDGDSDICVFTKADIAIAYRPRSNRLESIAHIVVSDFNQAIEFIEENWKDPCREI